MTFIVFIVPIQSYSQGATVIIEAFDEAGIKVLDGGTTTSSKVFLTFAADFPDDEENIPPINLYKCHLLGRESSDCRNGFIVSHTVIGETYTVVAELDTSSRPFNMLTGDFTWTRISPH